MPGIKVTLDKNTFCQYRSIFRFIDLSYHKVVRRSLEDMVSDKVFVTVGNPRQDFLRIDGWLIVQALDSVNVRLLVFRRKRAPAYESITTELVRKMRTGRDNGGREEKHSPFFPNQRLGTCTVGLFLNQLFASGHSSERVDESQSGQKPRIGDHDFCLLPKRLLNSCESNDNLEAQ